MNKLILHIGHGKTGSSFIQSMLALNAGSFKKEFYYPHHKSFEDAAKGHVTSGNGILLYSNTLAENHKTTLLSSEEFFYDLLGKQNSHFQLTCKKYDVSIILYSRNILDHLYSLWGELVKRRGLSLDFDNYLVSVSKGEYRPYSFILKWLDAADKLGFNLIFRNYSNHRANLFDVFLKDVSENCTVRSDLKFPTSSIVNRSLSNIENEFQRVFNAFDKQSGRYISDRLVNLLPNIPSSKPRCSGSSYELISEKINPLLNCINNRIPPSEALKIGHRERFVVESENENQSNYFTSQQIEVLADSLIKEFSSAIALRQSVNNIRDIALKIESNKRLDLEDALVLLKVAQILRPDGPLISQKVLDWEEKLQIVR